ncbi:MAG: hypothetical protein M1289_02820 [Patescibacteria group bacterium]|nr:hypothetical protein [Patescibacteria group bacterium]
MKVVFLKNAEKSYKSLPLRIQKKADKQFLLLISNYRHPSLRTRKMGGLGHFEARIDIHYRFTFEIAEDNVIVRTIGPHDQGLGKK